jgi:hypothetical protein
MALMIDPSLVQSVATAEMVYGEMPANDLLSVSVPASPC